MVCWGSVLWDGPAGTLMVVCRASRDEEGALTILGNGLLAASYYDEALVAYQCCLVYQRNVGGSVVGRCWNGNLAVCFQKLGRARRALSLERETITPWV